MRTGEAQAPPATRSTPSTEPTEPSNRYQAATASPVESTATTGACASSAGVEIDSGAFQPPEAGREATSATSPVPLRDQIAVKAPVRPTDVYKDKKPGLAVSLFVCMVVNRAR